MKQKAAEPMDVIGQGMAAMAMSLAWTMGTEHAEKFSRGLALIASQYESQGMTSYEHMVMLLHEASRMPKPPNFD